MQLWKIEQTNPQDILSYVYNSNLEIYGSTCHVIPETKSVVFFGGFVHSHNQPSNDNDTSTSILLEYNIEHSFSDSNVTPSVHSICKVDCLDEHFASFQSLETTTPYLNTYQIIPTIDHFCYEM